MDKLENSVFLIQRKIAFILFGIGITISLVNFFHAMQQTNMFSALLRPSVMILFFLTLIFFLTAFIRHRFARIVQVFIGFLNGAIAILDVYDSIFGLGLFIIFSIVAYKYGFYRKYAILKVAIEVTAVYVLTIISAGSHPSATKVMLGLDSVLYISFFLVIAWVTYSDEIKQYVRRNREAEETITELIKQREVLNTELEELNSRIKQHNMENHKLDFDELGITERERQVIEALVVFQDTQKQTAERMNIGYETVKTHLKHIREKLGVERKTEIIEMCRNNFI